MELENRIVRRHRGKMTWYEYIAQRIGHRPAPWAGGYLGVTPAGRWNKVQGFDSPLVANATPGDVRRAIVARAGAGPARRND